jgi:hypothetical protein
VCVCVCVAEERIRQEETEFGNNQNRWYKVHGREGRSRHLTFTVLISSIFVTKIIVPDETDWNM